MSEEMEPSHPVDVLVEGSGVYRFLKDGQEVTLDDGNGRTFSDESSRYWNVVKAVAGEADTGETVFQVLVKGESYLAGRYQVWSADAAGVITEKSGWKTGDQMLLLGFEDIFGSDLNEDEVIGEMPAVDNDGDGLIDASIIYKILHDNQGIALSDGNDRTFSDESSRYWNVVKAVAEEEDTGETVFRLLVKGESYLADRYQVWSADAAGVITGKSRWKTGDQMLLLGFEDTFNRDLNKDEIIGEPPAIDLDGDGLIDRTSVYKILKDDQGIKLTDKLGRTFSDKSSSYWDVVQAVADETDTGETVFQMLVKGESYLADRYQVWTADAAGVIQEKSRWMKGEQMQLLGYEDTFNRDLNKDEIIGEPPAIDLDGDGLIDRTSVYKILKDDQAIKLTDKIGRVFSDESSSYWDVVQAVAGETDQGETIFHVLLEGESTLAGKYQVWTADAAGVIEKKSRWMTGKQMLSLDYEDTFNRDLNKDEIIGEPPAIDLDGDGLIDGSSIYKILKDDQGVKLTDKMGRTFSDESSYYWNVVKAVEGEIAFQVLVEGEGYLAGRYQVWTTDADAVIEEKSRWVNGQQMQLLGYEDTFNRDFNEDEIIGEPPVVDVDGDGLIDVSIVYKIFENGQGIMLTDKGGRTFSDESSSYWNVVKAVAGETGAGETVFQMLVKGESYLAGRYRVWTADAAGVIQEKSRWMKGEQMQLLGYEDTFNRDFNEDGIIGEPPAVDVDGDGLIDGSNIYKILKDGQGITLSSTRGRTMSDQTSSYWDVVKVVSGGDGFQLLVEGESYLDGRYQVWTASDDGAVTNKSRWMTGDQMLLLGYEETFDSDINRDEIIGEPPAIDLDGDGLIDGSIVYKILKDDQAIKLTDKLGRTFSDKSSSYWDVVQAVAEESGAGETVFQMLVKGEGYFADRYQVWTASDAGLVTDKDKSPWMTGGQMLSSGYEDVFSRDFNGDGLIAPPILLSD